MRRHLPFFLVLLIGTALSSLVFQMKKEAVSERQRAMFAELAHTYASSFQAEIDRHVGVLESLRDFTLASPALDQEGFSVFTGSMLERAPALTSVKWLPLGEKEAKKEAANDASSEDFDGFTFRAGEARRRLSDKSERLRFPESQQSHDETGNLAEWDNTSDRIRSSTVAKAYESGRLAVSEPFPMKADAEVASTVLLALPLISPSKDPQATTGFVVAWFDLNQLCLNLIRSQDRARIHLQLFDETLNEGASAMFSSGATSESDRSHRLDAPFSVGSRQWVLALYASDGTLPQGAELEAWSLLAGGLVFTLFATIWTRQRLEYVRSVEAKVNQRTVALSRSNADLENEIAQRRHAETELRQSEARFREAFLHAPVGIALLSPEGTWTQANQALCDMTGFTECELYQYNLANMLHPEEAPRQIARMGQMLAGEITTFALEGPFRHKNGHYISVLMNVSQVRDEDQRLLYFVCQILDITQRNRALAETRRAKEFSENIINSSSDGIFAFDVEGNFTVWNSGMEAMTGILEEDALGRTTTEVLPFLTDTGDDRAFQRVLAGGTVKAAERPFSVPSSGRSGYFAGHYAPLHDDNGRITGGVAVVRDVTAQRKARERLQRYTELLKQRNRELQDFAYVASHDLQEPLRKIRAFGDRLVAKCETILDDQARDYLTRMQDAAQRMQTLIHDLLSFSRVSTEARPFEKVDLNVVAREVLSDLESRIEETGAQVELEPLPEVEADASQMRQLLQNLIGNGLKYHRAGVSPHIKVYATQHAAEDHLPPLERAGCLLHIQDNGIGFDEKYLDRIFTVFQRLHGRNEFQGTGVGLAICRKIAERHNGWITARSTPGEGSVFITALPYKQHHKN